MARERPLKTSREVTQSWPRRFRCGYGCRESRDREFGWLGVVNVDGSPSRTIIIHHLIRVGDPLDHEWALPSWGQLVGTLGRSSEYKYEASLAVWVGSGRSWGWGHLLVGEREPLLECLHICGRIIQRWRGASVALEVWRQGGLSPCGDHGGREAMGLMGHGVQCQHDVGDFVYPGPGGGTIKQASLEHIIYGPMAPLVDGVPLWMVVGGE